VLGEDGDKELRCTGRGNVDCSVTLAGESSCFEPGVMLSLGAEGGTADSLARGCSTGDGELPRLLLEVDCAEAGGE
jgi:hypothetical protein